MTKTIDENKILQKYLEKYDEFNYASFFTNDDSICMYKMFLLQENYDKYFKKTLKDIEYRFQQKFDIYGYFDKCRCFAYSKIQEKDPNYELDYAPWYNETLLDLNLNKADQSILLFLRIVVAYEIFSTRININESRIVNLKTIQKLENDNNAAFWYRGQSDKKWFLFPSIFRDLNENIDIDYNYLNYLYRKYNLDNEYMTLINNESNELNLHFLAYMQHAISYSPLMDITSSPIIASSFASKKNKKDAKFFFFYSKENMVDEEKINTIIKEFNVKIIKQPLSFGKTIELKKRTSSNTEECCSIDLSLFSKLFDMLRPEYVTINVQTNDRMKYQKGAFILFFNYMSINGRIFYELNSELKYREYILPSKHKKNIKKYINKKYKFYSQEFIMSPYKYFEYIKTKDNF